MNDHRYHVLKVPTRACHQAVQAVQRTAKNFYRPPKVIADSVNQPLAISMMTIWLMQKQLESIPQTLHIHQGYRQCLHFAKIGDTNIFPNQTNVTKYAGLCVKPVSVKRL